MDARGDAACLDARARRAPRPLCAGAALLLALPPIALLPLAAQEQGSPRSADPAPSNHPLPRANGDLPDLDAVLAAGPDLWGEASLREPGGPSFDFFARLLPPLRYVNTRFRHYPIVLGRPDSPVKARFVSNGSGVNLRAGAPTWRDPGGMPLEFWICNASAGRAFSRFGEDLSHVDGPRYVDGFLPMVELTYRAGPIAVEQEAFASVAPPLDPEDAAVFVRFSLVQGDRAMVAARAGDGAPRDPGGRGFVVTSPSWSFDGRERQWLAELQPGSSAELCIFTRGAPAGGGEDALDAAGGAAWRLDAARYEEERRRCADHWRGVIERCARVATGERRVDDAWRALVVGTLLLASGDTLLYSAGNHYETTFEAECGDAARALMLFGVPQARRFVRPLLERPLQQGLFLSDVSYKLQLFAWRHQLDRDLALSREQLAIVLPEVERALGWIEPETGLVPAQAYCGDISTPCHNLLANAAFWRGLRDLTLVLRDLGGPQELSAAARFEEAAARLRERVRDAVERSERSDVSPPFIPIALFGVEKPYELLTQTKEGAYWNLIAPYVYDSGIFGPDSPRTQAMVDWQLYRGGTCMGMVRFDQHSGLFANEKGVDDLYTLRLVEELLRHDEADRAVVSLYGKLAQGMTRDTCIGGEGSSLVPLDEHGRPTYLPPNSAANAFFLWTLRHLLVQDFDLDQDGRAETLRLLFATPRSWLADGAHLEVKRAPTRFGELSLDVVSELSRGRVRVELELPPRPAARTLLRLRLPDGFRVERAEAGGAELPLAEPETLDLTGRTGRLAVQAEVRRAPPPR